jgi:transposase IS116/IS110/IS902 family protein
MLRVIEDLAGDWRRLDERIDALSDEIMTLARQDKGCERLMTVPGIGPIISSAMVAAIGSGDAFSKGRDFGAWLGLVPKQMSTGDRTILGSISKRGNRYLRTLFVQAAWVVLVKIKPEGWERYGLKSWIESPPSRCPAGRTKEKGRPKPPSTQCCPSGLPGYRLGRAHALSRRRRRLRRRHRLAGRLRPRCGHAGRRSGGYRGRVRCRPRRIRIDLAERPKADGHRERGRYRPDDPTAVIGFASVPRRIRSRRIARQSVVWI